MRPVTWLKSLHDRWKSFNERKLCSSGGFFYIFRKSKQAYSAWRPLSEQTFRWNSIRIFSRFPLRKQAKFRENQKQQSEEAFQCTSIDVTIRQS